MTKRALISGITGHRGALRFDGSGSAATRLELSSIGKLTGAGRRGRTPLRQGLADTNGCSCQPGRAGSGASGTTRAAA